MALWIQWLPPWSTLHPGKLDKAFNLVHRPAWVGWYDVLTLILKGYCRKKSIISDSLMGRQNRKVSSGDLNFMPLPRELSLVMVPSYSPDAPVSSTSWYFPGFFFFPLTSVHHSDTLWLWELFLSPSGPWNVCINFVECIVFLCVLGLYFTIDLSSEGQLHYYRLFLVHF